MKRACCYIRMSDPDQELSPERQWDEITARAAKDGYTIDAAHRYEDHGRSGWKRVRRVGFDRLRRDLDSGRLREAGVERLYVWRASRLARRMLEQIAVIAEFEKGGVEVLSTSEVWPEDPSIKQLVRAILAWVDQHYSDQLSDAVKSGMRAQARRGYWQSRPPYGYDLSREAPDAPPRLIIVEEEAAVVREIFRMRVEDNDGARKIAERLTRGGTPPPIREDKPRAATRDDLWSAKHVLTVLSNQSYTGAIMSPKAQRDPDRKVVCENAHPAIITLETFLKAKDIMAGARRNKTTRNPLRLSEQGLFRPWMRCASCAGPVTVTHGGRAPKRWYYYKCSRAETNVEACDGFSVRTDVLDPLIAASIEESTLTPEGTRNLLAATIVRLRATPAGERDGQRVQLDREERELGVQIDRLIKLVEATGDVEEGAKRIVELRERRTLVRGQRAKLPAADRSIPDLETVDVEAFRRAVTTAFAAKDVPTRRKALARILARIVLSHSGTIDVELRANLDPDPAPMMPHQLPLGPPEGSAPINRRWVRCGEVSRPKFHMTAAL